MAQTGKALADGYLATSQGAIYTCPVSTVTYISEIELFQEHATPQTVTIWIKRDGTARKSLYRAGWVQNSRAVRSKGLILQAGDTIEGATTTATAVAYAISGVEET